MTFGLSNIQKEFVSKKFPDFLQKMKEGFIVLDIQATEFWGERFAFAIHNSEDEEETKILQDIYFKFSTFKNMPK